MTTLHRAYDGPRPSSLPKNVADALADHDTARDRYRAAEKAARDLAAESHDRAAEKADRDAAIAAAAKGSTIPDPVAVPTLRSDREKAARALEAHASVINTAVYALNDARRAAAELGEKAEQERRVAAAASLAEQAEALATAAQAEAAARAGHEWLRTGSMGSATAPVAAWDILPVLRSYGMGPGMDGARGMIESAPNVVRRVIAAAFTEEV